MNVLSLFDGMSCMQIALKESNIKVDTYYASEIEKYPIQVTQHNFPNTIQLGDVRNVDVSKLKRIDILAGGSPCQSFSFAGKRKGMSTKCDVEIYTLEKYLELKNEGFEFEGQSYLFWEYMRILTDIRKYNPDVKFLLENVEMGKKWERVLSEAIGVYGVHINSALVSAQNRKRIYWTNIKTRKEGLFGDLYADIPQPKDEGILLKDILEKEVDEKYYLSDKMIDFLNSRNKETVNISGKSSCFTAGGNSGGLHSQMDLIKCVAMRGRNPENPKSREAGLETEQQLEPREDGKTNCLTTVQKDNLVYTENYIQLPGYRIDNQVFYEDKKHGTLDTHANRPKVLTEGKIRRLTPLECERLQTVKDGYTSNVSDTQRFRMLGNGWTIKVISHILSFLK